LEGFTQTQISTLAVKDNFLVAGGFQGELICKVSHVLAAIHVDGSSFFFFGAMLVMKCSYSWFQTINGFL
jgi:hypothetical protein